MRGMIEMRADYSQTDRHSELKVQTACRDEGSERDWFTSIFGAEKKNPIMLTRGKEDHEVRTG